MKFKILSWMMFALLFLGLNSCNDDDLLFGDGSILSSKQQNNSGFSHLVLQEDGYWRATERVPLVGQGRIVDNVATSLVSVGDIGMNTNALIDTDLDNCFEQKELVGANVALNQIVSIRDLNYVYAGGQKAGFLCKNLGSSVLELDVLNGFWIDTYLKGERQEHKIFTKATSVLDLGIGNISGGTDNKLFLVEAEFSKPFDEVRLGNSGVKAEAVKMPFGVYYAYVGENPMIPAVNNGNAYFNNKVTSPYEGSYVSASRDKLIDDDLSNGIELGTVSKLFQPHMSVNFGRDVPEGSEVGFYVTAASALNLGVGQSILVRTFDENDKEMERYSYTKVVALDLLGAGKYIYSLKTTKPCRRVRIDFLGVSVDLGAMMVHYAFVREKTTIDPSSYFTIANATVYNPNYRFSEVKNGTVKYEIVGKPERSNAQIVKEPNGKGYLLTGMNYTGNYTVKAIYTDEQGNTSEQIAVITRLKKKQTSCEECLVNTAEHPKRYEAYGPDGFKGIVLGGGSESQMSNVVNQNKDLYAEYKEINISLINNQALIGVKTIDKSTINKEKAKKRVGFVINKSLDILGGNVLQFMRIKLFKGDEQVGSNVAKENNGISLSLIGSSKDKVRLSVDTDVEFDRVELYATGLASISLGQSLHIYYAFIEETKDCGDPGEECMQLVSNANYGAVATIDVQGLANVGVEIANMGNIVDNSLESYALYNNSVKAATGTTIKVNFNTIKANQEVGFVLTNVTGLTNVELIDVVQIKAFYQGQPVNDDTTSGGLLGLKLTGSGQRKYISVTPKHDIDELHLIIGDGVHLLDVMRINGVYLRPDYDGDGVMDCVKDELSTEITNLYVEPQDICKGGQAAFRVDGGETGVTYQLEFEDKHDSKKTYKGDVTINETGYLDFTKKTFFETLPIGEYYVSVLKGDGTPVLNKMGDLTIHPLETTWKKDAKSNDWNAWENWDRGTPWYCTNVILPSSASRYPELKENAKKAYCCQNIHFEDGAELVGQCHLEYEFAFIDKTLPGGTYQLLSAPLRGMLTGDMFVQAAGRRKDWETWRTTVDANRFHTNYFTPVADSGKNPNSDYEENRVNPIIYQRFFSRTVSNAVMTRAVSTTDAAIINHTDWSRSFNAVGTRYAAGQGFALKVKDGDSHTFHFPKSHSIYQYFDITGKALNKKEAVNHTGLGQLMVDYTSTMPYRVDLGRLSSGTDFLFGNPFMAHINIRQFLNDNRNLISSLQIYRNGEYVTISSDGISSSANAPTTIQPMEAVILNARQAGMELSVVLTESMIVQANSRAARIRAVSSSPRIYLTARVKNHVSSCVAVQSVSASDAYRNGEDVPYLLETEAKPDVAVYTVANGEALSVQRMKAAHRISVGFYMHRQGQVKLSFKMQGKGWDGWHFVDGQTGKRYPLNKPVTLTHVATGSNRFYLEKAR